jgi:lipopolysaccharide biosynthesis glycosyltransferase
VATYYRYVIADCIPAVDKIIYLDCDMLVLDSLKPLWNTDISGHYVAGVSDMSAHKYIAHLELENKTYINAGMLLINAKKWRDDNISEKLFCITTQYADKLLMNDQDVINITFNNGGIKLINDRYNDQHHKMLNASKIRNKKTCIAHFIGRIKPWSEDAPYFQQKLFHQYSAMTSLAMPKPHRKILHSYTTNTHKVVVLLGCVRIPFRLKKFTRT